MTAATPIDRLRAAAEAVVDAELAASTTSVMQVHDARVRWWRYTDLAIASAPALAVALLAYADWQARREADGFRDVPRPVARALAAAAAMLPDA